MKQKEAIELLNISKSKFKMLVRMCLHIKDGSGNHFNYDSKTIGMFKRYIKAQKDLEQVKIEMGGGRIIRKQIESKYDRIETNPQT